MTQTTVTISGIKGGPIWQPGPDCYKPFHIDQERLKGATLRDIVAGELADGDFKSCKIWAASVIIDRTRYGTGRAVIRRRYFDLEDFPSVTDLLDPAYPRGPEAG